MKELKDIVSAYDEAFAKGKQTALATVVHVEGSSYRRPGARMLVTEDGEITGAISGGCLEGDALRKARLAILQQQNRLMVYDTTDEDDLKFGVQLGCNGIVSILFEPIKQEEKSNPISMLRKAVFERKEGILITSFGEKADGHHAGTCGYMNANEMIRTEANEDLCQKAAALLQKRISLVRTYSQLSVLYQLVTPSIRLVVAGAGNDAQPLVEMAAVLGWEIFIVDGRPTHATKHRFPKAEKIIVCRPHDVISNISIDTQTGFLLMTHNYNYDVGLLEQLLPTDCGYIGILGPKKKTQRMLDEIIEKGFRPGDDQLSKIHGPVGLDIGAEGAEEIALSILAEIKAFFAKRAGSPLKLRKGSIYERV